MDLVLIFAVASPWVFVVLGCWLGFQFLRQNGRILVRLDAIDERLKKLASTAPAETHGLPVGAPAPTFDLPTLSGERMALQDFAGRSALLIFFDPGCGFCSAMASDIASLPLDAPAPLPLIITTGDATRNRDLVTKAGIRAPVLLQEAREVMARYQVRGTPGGYLIDAQGRIASEVAMGAPALLSLASQPIGSASSNGSDGVKSHHAHHKKYAGNRPIEESRLNRTGLPAGTTAPLFTLPAVNRESVALEDYRGRSVLLVFSDPECGPCDILAPQLERMSRNTPQVDVLMVSRGSREANVRKLNEHRLSFPVALQQRWEISRLYGMFATPIGYLIDASGVISADVAVGADAILGLFEAASRGKATVRREAEVVAAGSR